MKKKNIAKAYRSVDAIDWRIFDGCRYGVVDSLVNGFSLADFFAGEADLRRIKTASLPHQTAWKGKDLAKFDMLIVAQDVAAQSKVLQKNAMSLAEYVARGGVCWIMHQEALCWESAWPANSPFADVCLMRKHEERESAKMVGGRQYVAPWITQRRHPVWNTPNHLDEGDFVFWQAPLNGRTVETTATGVVVAGREWKVLARHADDRTPETAGLVLERRHGKGLFIWTQIFSPQIFGRRQCFEAGVWRKFLQNILTYARDFRMGRQLEVEVRCSRWALKAGESVKIAVRCADGSPSSFEAKIFRPDGSMELLRPEKAGQRTGVLHYKPEQAGEYRVQVEAKSRSGGRGCGSSFFKVSKGWTPYRFFSHAHFGEWSGLSPGVLYGVCRRMGIDAALLSPTRSTPSLGREMAGMDSPSVRFFPGGEFHFFEKPNKHLLFFNLPIKRLTAILGGYDSARYDESWIKRVQSAGGLVVAAHPEDEAYWVEGGCDGMEFEPSDRRHWDRALRQGKRVFGLPSTDNGPIQTLKIARIGLMWLKDEPLDWRSFLAAIKDSRVMQIGVESLDGAKARTNVFWMDVNGLLKREVTVEYPDVDLRIRAQSECRMKTLSIIRDGKIVRRVRLMKNDLDEVFKVKIGRRSYLRVEMAMEDGRTWLSNPVFIEVTGSARSR
ncbi:MAG: hypothetical protein PHV34_15010 [Verrucomicrobiae bacterium]|nr:hypothetical protein [Verrucomicrobiae bacterium]